VLGTLLLAGVAYRVSLDEYNEALDANLRQVALSVARLPAGAVRSSLPAHHLKTLSNSSLAPSRIGRKTLWQPEPCVVLAGLFSTTILKEIVTSIVG
jgi:hypothetical protein